MRYCRRYQRDTVLVGGVLIDTACFFIACLMGYFIRLGSGWFEGAEDMVLDPDIASYFNHFIFGTLLFLLIGTYRGLYSDIQLLRLRNAGNQILRTCILWVIVYLCITLVFRFNPAISRWFVVLTGASAVCLLILARYGYFRFLASRSHIQRIRQSIIFVGLSDPLSVLIEEIRRDPLHPYQVVGWLKTRGSSHRKSQNNSLCLGVFEDLQGVIEANQPDILILADMDIGTEETEKLMHLCVREGIEFKLGSNVFPVFGSGLKVQTISGVALLGVQELPIENWYNRALKRGVDIVGGFIGLLAASPVILLFGFLVKRESPGPMLYRQIRSGRWGQAFEILKIRSMRLDAEKHGVGWSTPGDPRRLHIGEFMRKWNLDELPQFWNVLKGEMSLVGPRPERPELIEDFKYKIRLYNIRHGVKPGLTGWAQVNGWRGDTDLEERIRHDLYYMENWSIWLDIQILLLTLVRYKNAH